MEDLIAWATIIVVFAVTTSRAMRNRRERRKARKQLAAVPALEPGTPEGTLVKVTGIVRAIETLTAPLSGRTCVGFRARAEIPAPKANNYTVSQPKRFEMLELSPFKLERDGEAAVLVDGSSALLDLPALTERETLGALREKFLVGRGITLREATRAQFEEVLVEAGMTITVTGLLLHDIATEPTADERDYRSEHGPTLRLTGSEKHPLAIGGA